MVELMKDTLLSLYVRAASRLRLGVMARDQRGQAFTDYLIVIAVVTCILLVVAPKAGTMVTNISASIFGKIESTVTSLMTGAFGAAK